MTTVTTTLQHARGSRLLGRLGEVRRDRLGLMTTLSREYGDAVRFTMGGARTLYFFNRPDLAHDVLVEHPERYTKGIGLLHARKVLGNGLLTSEGETWRAQRRRTAPRLRREVVARSSGLMADQADALSRQWLSTGGTAVDVVPGLTAAALAVLGPVALGLPVPRAAALGEAFAVVQAQAMFEMLTLNALPSAVPTLGRWRLARARRLLQAVVREVLAAPEATSDLVADLRREHADGTVDLDDITDELVTLLLAGHETTASTLTWALYELSRDPALQARLAAEARTASWNADGGPGPAALPQHVAFLHETLRMHPPVWLLPRRAVVDHEVCGIPVAAGADVLICPYTLHRHPDFWPRPDTFDPDRFRGPVDRSAYLPFGAGPRGCVGAHLGLVEATVVLARLVAQVEFAPGSDRAVRASPQLTLGVRGGLPLLVRPREGRHADI